MPWPHVPTLATTLAVLRDSQGSVTFQKTCVSLSSSHLAMPAGDKVFLYITLYNLHTYCFRKSRQNSEIEIAGFLYGSQHLMSTLNKSNILQLNSNKDMYLWIKLYYIQSMDLDIYLITITSSDNFVLLTMPGQLWWSPAQYNCD